MTSTPLPSHLQVEITSACNATLLNRRRAEELVASGVDWLHVSLGGRRTCRTPSPTPIRPGDRGCDWPWEAVYITSTGAVQPCCMVMGDDRATLGHLGERSFPEIWDGPAYRDFRRRLMSADPPDVCRGCAFYRGMF